MAMSMVSARLEVAQPHLCEPGSTPLYVLTLNLRRLASSVGVGRNSAWMKGTVTFGDAELQVCFRGAVTRRLLAFQKGAVV